jgi:hypothetical protein
VIESANLQLYSKYREARRRMRRLLGGTDADESPRNRFSVCARCARSASWRAASRRAPPPSTRRTARWAWRPPRRWTASSGALREAHALRCSCLRAACCRSRSTFGALDASLAAGGGDAAARYASLYAALDRFEAAVLSALNVTPAQIA